MSRLSLVSISLFCILINAFGQMPHEVLVIANQSSEEFWRWLIILLISVRYQKII